MLRYFLFLFLL